MTKSFYDMPKSAREYRQARFREAMIRYLEDGQARTLTDVWTGLRQSDPDGVGTTIRMVPHYRKLSEVVTHFRRMGLQVPGETPTKRGYLRAVRMTRSPDIYVRYIRYNPGRDFTGSASH